MTWPPNQRISTYTTLSTWDRFQEVNPNVLNRINLATATVDPTKKSSFCTLDLCSNITTSCEEKEQNTASCFPYLNIDTNRKRQTNVLYVPLSPKKNRPTNPGIFRGLYSMGTASDPATADGGTLGSMKCSYSLSSSLEAQTVFFRGFEGDVTGKRRRLYTSLFLLPGRFMYIYIFIYIYK